jgi:hypothetical protein
MREKIRNWEGNTPITESSDGKKYGDLYVSGSRAVVRETVRMYHLVCGNVSQSWGGGGGSGK